MVSITISWVFLCYLSVLLDNPWVKLIWILPDRIISGNIAKATNVTCQLNIKAILSPTIIVLLFYAISPK